MYFLNIYINVNTSYYHITRQNLGPETLTFSWLHGSLRMLPLWALPFFGLHVSLAL